MVIGCCVLVAAGWLQAIKQQGAALETQQRWAEASTIYSRALLQLGDDGGFKDRFWLLTSLVEVSFDAGDYRQARVYLERAERECAGLAADAAERVRLLNAWGTLHLVEGNLTAAERALARASDLPAEQLDRAATLHTLAAVETHTRHLESAAAHEMEALKIWREKLGERHPYVMKAWISLSSIQGLGGNWAGAAASLEKVLSIRDSREATTNYAVVLDHLGRHREARNLRRRNRVAAIPVSGLVDVRELGGAAVSSR